MQPLPSVPSRRIFFAACILAIGGVAARPAGADPGDGGGGDAGLDASTADASPGDASPTADTGVETEAAAPGLDATVADANVDGGTASDDSSMGVSTYVMDDGALPTYSGTDIFQRLCVDNPDAAEFSFSSVASPYATGDVTACTNFVAGHTAARACLCKNCFTLQQQCDALPGCREIQKCGLDSGCTDANSCYLLNGACVTPINNWGTGSVATALSQLLDSCGQAANPICPAQ
jgi:hypothetical protein